jgi:fatty acyl-CoA reductase
VWRFPGQRLVEKKLHAGERLLDAVDRVVTKLPRSDRVRKMVRRVDRERGRLEFVRRYADLYGAYVEAEVIYTDDRLLELYRSLPERDRNDFHFDARVIDWRAYLQDIHCPAVTMVIRVVTPSRPDPQVRVVPRQDGVLAVFDMEGTLIDSNVIESYLWLRLAELPREDWITEIGSVARRLPKYLSAERRDRGEFLRRFYRRYEGASVEGLRQLLDRDVSELLLRRTSPAAIRRIREHKAAGHRTVLITGALDVFVRPLQSPPGMAATPVIWRSLPWWAKPGPHGFARTPNGRAPTSGVLTPTPTATPTSPSFAPSATRSRSTRTSPSFGSPTSDGGPSKTGGGSTAPPGS